MIACIKPRDVLAMRTLRLMPACVIAIFANVGTAHGTSSQTDVLVRTTIPAYCATELVEDIVFPGAIMQTSTPFEAEGKIQVNCTNGAVYGLSIPQGPNDNGMQRRMRDGASNFLLYNLYASVADRSAEGALYATGAVSSGQLGNGSNSEFVLYARIPVQATPPMGRYTDQLTVTVSY